MRKKRIITTIVVVVCVLVGVFFVMRFGVLGRIYNAVYKQVLGNKVESEEEEAPEELKYETEHDKDDNEYVVEYRKQIFTDLETGEEVEIWEDTAEKTIIYNNTYEGRIQKIEDNKIYFMVDFEVKEDPYIFENVKDYLVVFDIDTYDFESVPSSHYGCDFLEYLNEDQDIWGNFVNFYSADELEFLVGEYLSVQAFMNEDYYTGDRSKTLFFQQSSPIKSFILSLFFR
ncbi:MAG: hypothetical protein KJ568_00785 [Actinobacteria bacterium]|nr:hypothetical protein [Actinomycetota bacterium]